MRQPVTVRLDPDVLKVAKAKASGDNRTLTNYIETLMRRDLHLAASEGTIEVIAPANIRDSVPIPMEGETPEQLKRRNDLFLAVLEAGGH